MPTVQVPVQLTIDQLMAAVKQLSPAELREFMQQLVMWQHSQHAEEETALLACIKENSRLPAAEQRHFDRLRRKHQAGTLTESETTKLQALWQRVERMNVTRLEALAALAQRRGTDVRTCMHDLGLAENSDVF